MKATAHLFDFSRLVIVCLTICLVSSTAIAQQRGKDAEDEKFKPRTVELKTKDGLTLRALYFPSEKGKESVTVLLVHEWQGQGSPYFQLGLALQEAGCAVLIPDYRGHGGSASYVNARGEKEKFNVSRMGRRDVQNIIGIDLEKSKGFLKTENNEGNLNLNALVVVGIREGGVMASHWSQIDWSFPSAGNVKQSQDVKALVLVSPPKQLKRVSLDTALKDPNLLVLPIMIVGGTENPEFKDARRTAKRIEGEKRRAGGGTVRGLRLMFLKTPLSGPSLVNDGPNVIPEIVKFVTKSVTISDTQNPWIERR